MENLRSIILSLKPNEVQLVRDFYAVKTQKHNSKRLQLFELVLHTQQATDLEAAQLIYRRQPDSAFSQLKRRLKEDVLNFLMACPNDKATTNAALQAELSAQKMHMQGKLLLARGVREEAFNLLKKAQGLAEKYELTALQIEVNDTLMANSCITTMPGQVASYSNRLSQCLHVQDQLLHAKALKYRLGMAAASVEPNGQANLLAELSALKNTYEQTNSAKVGYWYYQCAIQYHLSQHGYSTAHTLGNDLLQLVNTHPALKTEANVAGIHMELSRILIHLGRYCQAVEHANKAKGLYKNGVLHELFALEALFFGCFRSQDYAHAAKIIHKAEKHQQYKSNEWLPNQWAFLKAGLYFTQQKFTDSLRLLRQINTFRKGNSTWALGLKLLEMLNLIEQGEYDWFESKIETFRKQLQPAGKPAMGRCKLIYKVFNTLNRTSFDYKHTVSIEEHNLQSLNEGRDGLYWDPMGYELIPVNHWIETKAG